MQIVIQCSPDAAPIASHDEGKGRNNKRMRVECEDHRARVYVGDPGGRNVDVTITVVGALREQRPATFRTCVLSSGWTLSVPVY